MYMKQYKKIGLLAAFAIIALASCKKYDGDSYDFSDKVKDYMRFTPGQFVVVNAETADSIIGADTFYYYVESPGEFDVETRVGFTEDIQFNYRVSLDNGPTEDRQGTMAMGTSLETLELAYGEDAFSAGDSILTGQIELLNASGGKYGNLIIGYPKEGSNAIINFIANKPNVLYPY